MCWPHLPFWGQKLGGRSTMVMGASMALMSSRVTWAFKEMLGHLVHQQMIYWQAGANLAVVSGVWVEHSWSMCKHPWAKHAGCLSPNSTFYSLPGAATGMTAAMTRQRRKAAAPRRSSTSGHVSRMPCGAVRKCLLALGSFCSLLCRRTGWPRSFVGLRGRSVYAEMVLKPLWAISVLLWALFPSLAWITRLAESPQLELGGRLEPWHHLS